MANVPFSAVVFTAKQFKESDDQMKAEFLMKNYEDARKGETAAYTAVQDASANLLEQRAKRARAKSALVTHFGTFIEQVAMEPNWEPFRDSQGQPAVENFMSERDQRNAARLERVKANSQSSEITSRFAGMFEQPETEG